MVNVSAMTGSAVSYVTSVYVASSANNQGQYELYYNSDDCTSSHRMPHTDENENISVFSLAAHEAVDTLPVHCIWIVFPTSVGPDPMVIQVSFLNDKMYILAKYFAIIGEWSADTTTNDPTQTATPVITSEVTTEVTTTVTEVTTTVNTGTTGVQDTTITSSGQSTTNNTLTTNQVSTITSSSGIPTVTSGCVGCPCVAHQYVNYSAEEIRRRIQYLQTQLTVNKKTLSSYKRKRTSAVDNRDSAVSLGSLGVLVIITSISLVVCSDLVNLRRFFRLKKQRAAMRDKMME
ncbi:uncharacterized protein LOC110441529 [Mizuhopecten yessoensis]|uniref:uncharacterized protein LOC110441529 n=1 Tax=Mizuhopecten yessoensis TaxID=6573 RepID=UPI000B45B8E6|nr:uncharacterized protein LOC110441529 [Mizuhopecten yessoensis]